MSHFKVELRDILNGYRNAKKADPGEAIEQLERSFGIEFHKRFKQEVVKKLPKGRDWRDNALRIASIAAGLDGDAS